MSWIQKLYETYENCEAVLGSEVDGTRVPLLPICHTTQKAHVEIVIDENGNFKRAQPVPNAEARTIIPCSEKSGGRTSGPAAHPLCDKLQYVARDYADHGGKKEPRFDLYEKELKEWCDSKYSNPKVKAILAYVQKGSVVGDLIANGTLLGDENGRFLKKTEYKGDKNVPSVFDVLNSQEDAFVRWIVEIPDERETRTWRDKSLWEKWIHYYIGAREKKALCYVSGEAAIAAEQHPAKLRNDADKGKLISGNDSSGFTFRGRFLTSDQAAGVSLEVTQKAHSALRWLISRQGYRRDDQAIVAWATSGTEIPQFLSDPLEIIGLTDLTSDETNSTYTAQEIGIKFRNRIAGYGSKIGNTTDVVVMGLDSATPGRTSIIFYRELTGSEYLGRINAWHETCVWLHRYRFIEKMEKGKTKRVVQPFIGAPSPNDIAEAAYAANNNGKFQIDGTLRKVTTERLLPCIIDGRSIPRDVVESTARRATNRVGMENWQWEKTLSIACALFKKHRETEDYSMALDPERKTRDYLYGRLLALADSLEQWALNLTKEDRQTTAARLMNRFAERPYSTWRTIELALQPYKARLGRISGKRQKMIDEVVSAFEPDNFTSDKRLSGEFLLGFHSQREFLRNGDKSKETEDESDKEDN